MDLKKLLYDGMTADSPVSGSLLIAEPIMGESIFSRSVILVIDSMPDKSHVGLILNKPLPMSSLEGLHEDSLLKTIPTFIGGPVETDRCTILHTLGNSIGETVEILPGLYLGADIEKLIDYIEKGNPYEGKIRFYLGYSGWGSGQLENEISRNTWTVNNLPEPDTLLYGSGASFWREQVKQLGPDYRSWLMVPPHPSFN